MILTRARSYVFLALALASTEFAAAQIVAISVTDARPTTRPAASEKRALEVVERAIAATGGRERIAKIAGFTRRAVAQSSFNDAGMTRQWVDVARKGFRLDIVGPGFYRRIVVDGGRVQQFEFGESMDVKEPERGHWLRRTDPWPELGWASGSELLAYAGTQDLEGRATDVVDVYGAADHVARCYYDSATGRLSRRVETEYVAGEAADPTITTDYGAYREASGVYWATEVRRRVGNSVNTITYELPEVNVKLPEFVRDASARPADEELFLHTIPRKILREPSAEDFAFDELQFRVGAPNFDDRAGGSLSITLLDGETAVLTQQFAGGGLSSMRDPADERAGIARPPVFLVQLRIPAKLRADHVKIELREGDAGRAKTLLTGCERFEPLTELQLPLRVPATVVTGHRVFEHHASNSAQAFALDLVVCDVNGRVLRQGTSGDVNEDYLGFGEPVIAPAPGTVVHVRDDYPDNPRPHAVMAPISYRLDPEGVVGNVVVLDHGQGEFSLVAHLRQGSVAVKLGETVARGQVLGRIGNSGQSTGPHLHYQLMDGPRPLAENGLPPRFRKVVDLQFERRMPFLRPGVPVKPAGYGARPASAPARTDKVKEGDEKR